MNKRVSKAFIHLLQVVLATAGARDHQSDEGLHDLLSKPYESHFPAADLLSDLTEYGSDDLDTSFRPSLQNAFTRDQLKSRVDLAPAAKFNFPRQQYYYQNVPSIYRVPTTPSTTTTESTTTSSSSTSVPTPPTTPDCPTLASYANPYVSPSPTCHGNYTSQPQPNPAGSTTHQPSGGVHYTIIYPPVTNTQPHLVVAPQIVVSSIKAYRSEYDYIGYLGYDCSC